MVEAGATFVGLQDATAIELHGACIHCNGDGLLLNGSSQLVGITGGDVMEVFDIGHSLAGVVFAGAVLGGVGV